MTNAVQVAVRSMPSAEISEWVIPFATALFGAFAGALAAFWLDRMTRRKEDRDRKIMAGDQALFALHQQLQDMLTIYNHIGQSGWTAPFAMIISQLRINRASLVFLRREYPDDLNKILEAERWYWDVCDALKDYNQKASLCNAAKLGNVPPTQLVLLCDERDRVHKAMVQTIRIGVKHNHISTRTLHRILTTIFKKVKFSVPGANKEIEKQFKNLQQQVDAATNSNEKKTLKAQIDDLVFKLYMLGNEEGKRSHDS